MKLGKLPNRNKKIFVRIIWGEKLDSEHRLTTVSWTPIDVCLVLIGHLFVRNRFALSWLNLRVKEKS